MNAVTVPYHFVPLSKWTCLPDWAGCISHDRPFRDGISGRISLSIENESPLLVGNSSTQNNTVAFVKDPQGNPVIPGSSIRGMIRNVLEIASFADMNLVDDARFGARDISSTQSSYYQYYNKFKSIAGWLQFRDNQWFFSPCDFVEIRYSELSSMNKKVDHNSNPIEKYQHFPLKSSIRFTIESVTKKNRGEVCYARVGSAGVNEGYLVFVGPMNKKVGDYVFYPPGTNEVALDNTVVRDFIISHRDYGGQYGSAKQTLYEYLTKHQHPQFGMPVFALKTRDRAGQIRALGLSKMMKIAVPYGIHYLRDRQKGITGHAEERYNHRVDLVQCIFGMTRDHAGYSLKSRVSFGDAQIESDYRVLEHLNPTVLGGPKASYFPAYLEQEKNKKNQKNYQYKDYFTSDSQLSGWKRYPLRNMNKVELPEPPNENENVAVILKPLDKGARFSCVLRFHNLKKVELGALLWALTFGGETQARHHLGMAKPYGFGKIKLDVKSQQFETFSGETLSNEELVNCFCDYMEAAYQRAFSSGRWQDSPQIQNLLAMHIPVANSSDFNYMKLEEYTKSKNRANARVLLSYQQKSRKEPIISERDDDNFHFQTDTLYSKEQEIKFKEAELRKKQEEEERRRLEQEAQQLEQLKAQVGEVAQQVLDAIEKHKKDATYSLDTVCQLIIDKNDAEAAKCFDEYITGEGSSWKKVKNKKKKEARKQWIEKIKEIAG